jgi:hypothetical protein
MQKTIALLASPGNPIFDPLVPLGNLPFATFDTRNLGLPDLAHPYDLPFSNSSDTVLVTSDWLRDMARSEKSLVSEVLPKLRHRFDHIVGLDLADPFLLAFADEVMSFMDVVLKINGLYSDLDLYNYIVGAATAGGRWTEKSHARAVRYTSSNLDKLRLSVPAFIAVNPVVRRESRSLYVKSRGRRYLREAADRFLAALPSRITKHKPPRKTVHFFASLTHIQRSRALMILKKSSLPFDGGITCIPHTVAGLDEANIWKPLTATERFEITSQLQAAGLTRRTLGPPEYTFGIRDCKAVLSITGYGEVCYRMAEAWSNRRILVCQDLSHVSTLFPLQEGHNVIYCRPDLSDLVELLDDIECNTARYIDVAEQGHADWLAWIENTEEILRNGYAPLYGLAGITPCSA